MKKLLFTLCIGFQVVLVSTINAQTGTWSKLTNNAPHDNAGVMLLLTDGTVICHNATGGTYGTGWDKLTPSASGSYLNGTWTTIASMINDRFAFASQVLPSGKVWVAGGEYGAGGTASEVYNPVTNTWTACTGVPSGWNIYDAPSELLYNGKVIVGPEIGNNPSFDCLFYTPSSNAFTTAPSSIYNHDEAQWLKLPDSSVLFVGIGSRNSNRYIPQTNTWERDANVTNSIYDNYGEESGCGLMLPNGKAIFFGATQNNAIYTPSGNTNDGTWAAAASFPTINGSLVGQPDAPGAMMINGHILLAVSPIGTSNADEFRSPIYFVEYDYTTNAFTQVTSIITGLGADSIAGGISQQMSFLDLPDGNVLVSLNQTSISNEYWIYTPGSGPIPQGKPTINSILPDGCPNYKVTGKLFNGISEGASFGDDWQMATNYPLVRLSNGTNVYYAKTTNWNRIGAVQTDSLEDTTVFTVPSIPGGTYSLVVAVNGFASNPVLFNVFGVTLASSTNLTCYGSNIGSATVNAAGGISPYTYSWSGGGGTSSSASGLGAGTYTITATDNNGCEASTTVAITQPTNLVITTTSSGATDSSSCNGSAGVNAAGGTRPYTYSWSTGGQTTASISGQCTGSYCCTVTDANGCTKTTCVNVATGMESIESGEGQISVYPNPTNGVFTIQIPQLNGQLKVGIYNILGQNVKTEQIRDKINVIDLSNEPNGIYFYRIIKEDGTVTGEGKVVIQR
jgi:hypothetical protein